MPTYEYLCQACSHRFDQWQKMIDDPLVTCPECGGHIRRGFFPAGIVFKGSGFYKTDHRSPSAAADANGNGNGHSTKGEEAATSAASNESKAPSDGKSTTTETSSGSKGTSTGENKAPAATTATK